jgi:hypothetical protein
VIIGHLSIDLDLANSSFVHRNGTGKHVGFMCMQMCGGEQAGRRIVKKTHKEVKEQ